MVLGGDGKVEVLWDGAEPCKIDGVVDEVLWGRSEAVGRAVFV